MKTWSIVRREYLERVRTRGFLISTVLVPLFMGLIIVVPMLLSQSGGEEQRSIGLIDPGRQVTESLRRALDEIERENFALVTINVERRSLADGVAEMRDMIRDEAIDSGVVIDPDFVNTRRAAFYSKSVSSMMLMDDLRPALNRVLSEQRFQRAGVSDSLRVYLAGRAQWERITVTAEGEETEQDEPSAFIVAVTMIMILYMMILFYGQHTLTGVIEEKNSRVVEILLSSVPTSNLMLGKVLGIGMAGLTQFAIWTATLTWLSGTGFSVGGFSLDGSLLTPVILVSFVVNFVLGFFLFAMLYAGVGALCNTVQDSQQFATPIAMCAIIPVLLLSLVIRAPDSTVAVVLSLIPLFTPILMFMRVSVQTPPLWQILLSWVLMIATILAAARVAGKLYRLGILTHGSAPSWRTVMKILRQPD